MDVTSPVPPGAAPRGASGIATTSDGVMTTEARDLGQRPVRVGLIGLSASGGWAAQAHLPALAAVDGFEVTALAASSAESAKNAGERYGVPWTFASAGEMAASDEVDLAIVAVQAAKHRDAVLAVIENGKDVYCEWPLAVSVDEAVLLSRRARERGVRALVGLQARSAPVFRYVRDLVASGWIGEVLSTTVVASGMSWGADADPRTSYVLDEDGGSTMLSIPFGHVSDVLTMCLGEFTELDAVMANRRPQVVDRGSGALVAKTAADQLAVHGVLEGGAVASIHFRGGQSRATNFRWEINGSEGDLVLTGDHGHAQLAPVSLAGARGADELAELPVPAEYHLCPVLRERPGDPAGNLANAYTALLGDLRTGTAHVPDFEHGVRRHELLGAVQRSAATGQRCRL